MSKKGKKKPSTRDNIELAIKVALTISGLVKVVADVIEAIKA